MSGKITSYPTNYDNESFNQLSPSESLNNITIGSIADNLEDNEQNIYVTDKMSSALYTRTHFRNKNHIFFQDKNGNINHNRFNKSLFYFPNFSCILFNCSI